MLHLNKCCNAKLYSIIRADEPAQTKTVAVVMLISDHIFNHLMHMYIGIHMWLQSIILIYLINTLMGLLALIITMTFI